MRSTDVIDAVDALQDELFELARELVRRPSVTGDETDAQHYIGSYWQGMGLLVDSWNPSRDELAQHPAYCDDGLPVERPVVVAQWGEGAPEERAALLLNGHIDVVPTGDPDRWRVDPFEGLIDQGVLHGRGSCDMKGGLAAATIAVRAAMRLGITPHRPVLLESVPGEETGGLGTLATICRGYRADAAVIAEPTLLAACPVQAGALTFRLHVSGQATHSAMRESGVSAIEKFWYVFQVLRDLENQRHDRFAHPLFDSATLAAPLSIGKLQAGNWPSTVPADALAEGRLGVFPGEDPADARQELEQTLRLASAADDWLRDRPVRVEWFEGQFEPGETDLNEPILATLSDAHQTITGHRPRVHGVPYGSDLRLFTRHAGMPAVLYGPGDVLLAHATDESVPLAQVVTAAQVLAVLICDTLGA